MRRLAEIVLANWGLKLVALVLAGALWTVVTQAPPVERAVEVPLELRALPPGLRIKSEVPSMVRLHLHGLASRMRRLAADQLAVVVDLRGATPGNHTLLLRPEMVSVPAGIEVVRITPRVVALELVRQ